MKPSLDELQPESRAQWRQWLAGHHDTSPGIWLILRKKRGGAQPLTLDEAVRAALCSGWIDSTLRPIDTEKSALKFTPRRRGGLEAPGLRQRTRNAPSRAAVPGPAYHRRGLHDLPALIAHTDVLQRSPRLRRAGER